MDRSEAPKTALKMPRARHVCRSSILAVLALAVIDAHAA
jgi:hypothetical protein